MNYLDERIIATVNFTTAIPSDGLYRYDVAINNEWESPAFVGNCFIAKGATSKTIDITDIVRNFYDFSYPYEDADFQAEWQVQIYTDETNTVLSNSIGIYPIYRYPNRKASLETPLSNNEVDWLQPALQGFDSEHKGTFLPHIPLIYSDKVDYNIALNSGNITNKPYLYSGVKKALQLSNYGIYNTQYKLSDLWTGSEVETLDWDFANLNADKQSDDYVINIGSLAPLTYNCTMPVTPKQIRFGPADDMYNVQQITEFPFVADIQRLNVPESDYLDVYIEQETDTNYIDLYPYVSKDTTVKAHIFIDEAFENDYTLIASSTGATQTEDYWLIDTPAVAELDITLRDENDAIVKTITVSQGNETFSILDTEGITQFEFVANGTNYDFDLADRCFAGNGAEYVFTFTLEGTDVKIYPIIVKYDVDVTFRTYRTQYAPLDQSNITIQNEGTDNLTASDKIRFTENKQTIEVVYGEQDLFSPASGRQIVSKLTNPTWSYALVDKTGKAYFGTSFTTTNNFPLVEGDFDLYIFATSGANYEVTKITTKDFGLAKSFSLQMLLNNTSVLLQGWIAVTADSQKYKDFVASKNIIEVAKVDQCPSRYYLQWRDRFGSMMQQPFSKAETYSEDFTRSEIKNYTDTRRLSNINIQPKWKLNSAWIPFDLVPYYESLMVSPWVKLCDSKEDQIYDVILKDTAFTEKTYRNNDRQLWHLEVEVEQTDKQNILY